MTAQMLDVDHSVFVAPNLETAHLHLTVEHMPTIRKRPIQVTPAEKLLLRLLVEVCATHAGTQQVGTDSQAKLAEYLEQFVPLIRTLAADSQATVVVTQELRAFFDAAHAILTTCRLELSRSLSEAQRQLLGDLLGQTASAYWWSCERQGLSGLFSRLANEQILDMLDLAELYAGQAWIRYPARSSLRHDDPSAVRMVQVPVALR